MEGRSHGVGAGDENGDTHWALGGHEAPDSTGQERD